MWGKSALLASLLLMGIRLYPGVHFSSKETPIEITCADGIKLKGTYYSPGKPGPGILLLHQCNMDRKCWNQLANALVERGIHVLTFDYRGYGESPGGGNQSNLESDIDAALNTLLNQADVNKSKIAVGGASCGVNNAAELARRSGKIKALLLLSGPPLAESGYNYLKANPNIAIFGAASTSEDFAVQALTKIVAISKNPTSTMKVSTQPGHGTPLFQTDSELFSAVTDWIVNALK